MNLWQILVYLVKYLIFQQFTLGLSAKKIDENDSWSLIQSQVNNLKQEMPSVMVVLMIRNKAHVLPTFLTYFENLDYPKKRIALW